MNIVCDLIMVRKYLDTAVKFYTQKYSTAITYGFASFGAIIFLIALITISVLLAKLGT